MKLLKKVASIGLGLLLALIYLVAFHKTKPNNTQVF